MRQQQDRNQRRATYGNARNMRPENREAREGREDRWQNSDEGQYGSQDRDQFQGQYQDQDRDFESRQGSYGDSRQGSYGEGRQGSYRNDFGGRFSRGEDNYGQSDRFDHSYGEAYRDQGFRGDNDRQNFSGGRDFGAYGSRDTQSQGGHAGKGPKSYKRSDERIQEEVYETLTWHNDIDATDIEVTVKEGEATLTGSVPDRKMKRLAEDVIEHVSGIKDVTNQLKVKKETGSESEASASSGSKSASTNTGTTNTGKKSAGAGH